jgi:hypothetical protein
MEPYFEDFFIIKFSAMLNLLFWYITTNKINKKHLQWTSESLMNTKKLIEGSTEKLNITIF